MRKLTVAGAAVLVVLGLVLVGAPAGAQSSGSSNEVGVSAKTIRVAVVADVDNPIAPNVLKGIVDGVQGWGKYVNATGGIGGRKVQVDFIDSKLNPNDTRNAIIKACSEDYALVGTGTLLLQTVADITSCPDSAGKATGVPDIAALVTNAEEGCAPTGYAITPPSVECNTRTQPT
jgi:ABC-type branched-subunit amino acid transport system substrate-binding protein